MAFPTRSLGRNGPQVSAVGFGAMSLGGAYGQQNSASEKLTVLDRAWELGVRFWDTADIYSDSEERIGEWFAKNPDRRADIVVATKFGGDFAANGSFNVYTDPDYVRAACDRSLAKLGIETIDLYYCNRVDGKTPIEKTMEVLVELKKSVAPDPPPELPSAASPINAGSCNSQGKIRHIGLSEVSAATIRRAHAVHPIAAVQVEYSPFCLDIESSALGILKTCRELGIAIVAYSPIGRGLLTGKIKSVDDLAENDFRRQKTKYSSPQNFAKIMDLVAKVGTVAERHGCTTAQVCIAWVMAQGADVIPIPGTVTIPYLEQNAAAAEVRLTEAEVAELRSYAEATELEGDRYPAG